MNAAEALQAARAAGIQVKIDGADLLLKASAPPPASVLDGLAQHKAGVLALLQPGRGGWAVEDWQMFFDERAAIAEFNGGLPRHEAEAQAFACCVVEWLNRNPVSSMPGRCLGCGGVHHAHDPLLPYGIEATGHVWLHSRCWRHWYEERKADAGAILKGMGIGPGRSFEAGGRR
jgi:hypothetical protein